MNHQTTHTFSWTPKLDVFMSHAHCSGEFHLQALNFEMDFVELIDFDYDTALKD